MVDKPATKTGLENLRKDLIAADHRIALGVSRNHARIDRLEETMKSQFAERTSQILEAVDGFAAQVGKIDRHQIITDYRVKALEAPHP